jgi:hypothetical protein
MWAKGRGRVGFLHRLKIREEQAAMVTPGQHQCTGSSRILSSWWLWQVNVAGRAAAVAPGNADTLAAFAGVYQTHHLPSCAGKPSDAGFELAISVDATGA